jgi:formate-dependent nitrite reductase membrane component NrfD
MGQEIAGAVNHAKSTMKAIGKRQSFWFGMVLLGIAITVFIASIRLVDVPGPMSPDKPEITFEFSKPLVVVAVIFAQGGGVLFARKFREQG